MALVHPPSALCPTATPSSSRDLEEGTPLIQDASCKDDAEARQKLCECSNALIATRIVSVILYVFINRLLRLLTLLDSLFPLRPKQGQQVLWRRGIDKYGSLRIPSLTVTTRGTLIAFCEGRKAGPLDTGAIDVVCKRSEDNGQTWSESSLVFSDKQNTCGNPCVVVDQQTGIIWLMMTHNLGEDNEPSIIEGKAKGSRSVWLCHSADDGLTWSTPMDITSQVKRADWTWYATGPGVGIQLQHTAHAGRLVVPCDHMTSKPTQARSHVVYSDDHGQTWQIGGLSPEGHRCNECQVIECCDGTLHLNMRTMDKNVRAVCYSHDGGLTFQDLKEDHQLLDPQCQGSIIKPNSSQPLVLFSNPACATSRRGMTLRRSMDDGRTWTSETKLHSGPAAYSSLCAPGDGTIACLYEAGRFYPYECILFETISTTEEHAIL